ncbi:MAG TPA: SLBB domain-containing protein [Gemmatimonadales bacterium]|nr:SLBB domain-containing protein [Gemmatimonadales bacterium]
MTPVESDLPAAMPPSSRWTCRAHRLALSLLLLFLGLAGGLAGQEPTVGGQRPTPDQARDLLRNQPGIVEQLRQRLQQSGLSPDQVRARLRAAGYPESMLDEYLPGADTTRQVRPGARTLDAVRALGILSPEQADSLQVSDSLYQVSDSLRRVLDSLKLVRLDSLRADSLADSIRGLRPTGLKIFGQESFRRFTTQFQPPQTGPVDANYRLGPGDQLILLLTGDVEQAYSLDVTREGFVVIPQVGQVYVANLTLGQLEDQLYARLGRVYSGVRRGPRATTKFQVSIARLKSILVYVTGDVVRAGAYQISAAGTVLTALYAAGGPSAQGTFRRVEVRRGGQLADSVDLYDYLLRGIQPTSPRLQNGDVVFVPVHGAQAKITGQVVRPAIYELRAEESLRDLIAFAGGFDPLAYQARVTIHRVLPAASRGPGGRARVVVAVGADQFVGGEAPAVPMAPGDSVSILAVADRQRGYVTVRGNVWAEGQIGYSEGMRLSDAIRLAGGSKPDAYLGRILVSRVREDSTMIQLRSAFADSTGRLTDDLVLQDEDEIRVFGRTAFLPERTVAVVGAVRRPGRMPYREGMTIRDAILLAGGPTDDAWLGEAEIARRAADDDPGSLAATVRVPLDSSYRFGVARPAAPGAGEEAVLQPYDNVLVMRQPGWELQRSVALSGQVKFPGRYSLRTKTERLRDVIERAGGLTDQAYAGGIEFYRPYLGGRPNRGDRLEPARDTLRIRTGEPRRDSVTGIVSERVGIDLTRVLDDARYRDNLIMIGGDSVHIPEYDPVVLVDGAVNAPGPVAYAPGKNLDWYVNAAGGYTQTSDQRHAYVVQPNGQREGVKRRAVFADAVPRPRPGARVTVPARIVQEQPSNLPGILATAAQVLGVLVTILVVSRR